MFTSLIKKKEEESTCEGLPKGSVTGHVWHVCSEPALATLELPYPSHTGNHSVRHTRGGGHYVTKEAEAYRLMVSLKASPGRMAPRMLAGPLRLEWLIAPPDRKARDVDNLMKVVCDALTRCGFWVDDSNKVLKHGSWQWTDPVPGGSILLTVWEAK